MDSKVIWKVEVLSSNSNSTDVKGLITKVTRRIENFSTIRDKKHYSENFTVDGNKWRIFIYPKVDKCADHFSIYLELLDAATLPSESSRYAQFGFALIDQTDRKTSCTEVSRVRFVFNAKHASAGFRSFLAVTELHNPTKGYLVNDVCLIEAYVSTERTNGLISRKLIVEISDKHKIKEVDSVQAIEPKERTKEDMETFFNSLESEFSCLSIVKETMAKLDEALDMNPANFSDLVNFSSLKQAFQILDSLDCSSIILTIEEKNELVTMDERLKELACRAAKAVQDKNLLMAKKSIKLSVTRNLECSLIIFKQLEQKLGALHDQVEEAQKNKEILFAAQMEIFKSCKKMKKEFETLGKEWAEYEANAKVAEEEEKNVKAEWKRIKDFISSIKGKI